MTAEAPQQNPELVAVRNSAEALFEDIPYGEDTQTRKVSGMLYMWGLPVVPVEVEQRRVDKASSDINIDVKYLLSDTSRVDQAVTYVLLANTDEPTVEQQVIFGDTWGREMPSEPFSEEPQTPLTTMRLAIELVRTKRTKALEAGHESMWRVG